MFVRPGKSHGRRIRFRRDAGSVPYKLCGLAGHSQLGLFLRVVPICTGLGAHNKIYSAQMEKICTGMQKISGSIRCSVCVVSANSESRRRGGFTVLIPRQGGSGGKGNRISSVDVGRSTDRGRLRKQLPQKPAIQGVWGLWPPLQ